MALTATTGFRYRKSLNGVDNPPLMSFRIGNSKTIRVGDLVRVDTNGALVLAGAGVASLGVVVGIEDSQGNIPFGYGYSNNTGATISGDDTVVTASDNLTRSVYLKAKVIADVNSLFYNDANGDFSLTNLLQMFDVVAASNQIDQASGSDTSAQMQLVELDPDADGDLSKGLFKIAESQLITQVGNGTAAINA